MSKLKKFGSQLKDGKGHTQDHQWSRRSFLNTMGLGGAMSMMMGGFPVRALSGSSFYQSMNDDDRILVMIQLGGGNDGLNTIIPLNQYDTYRNLRPRIGLQENQLIKLSDDIAIPGNCQGWESMWKDGQMKVIHNVGYPMQNLSHFRSGDIWSTASDSEEELASGWMGRYLEGEFPDFEENPPAIPPAVQIGGVGSLIFNNGLFSLSVSVTNPDELSEIAQSGERYDTTAVPQNCYGDELRFMRTVTNSTFIYSEAIQKAYLAADNQADFTSTARDLGDQLALVSRLIKGGLGTKLYMVSISGFDTHANQLNSHPALIQGISQAVKAFYEDLAVAGLDESVLTMTFSEFGRRIEENASQGTDHGSAAPLLLFGKGLGDSGFVGTSPDLSKQDIYGNLEFETDFRSVYATLLENWLCGSTSDVDQVLGGSFDRIEDLVIKCGSINTPTQKIAAPDIYHKVINNGTGEAWISYRLSSPAQVQLSIYSIDGRQVGTIVDTFQSNGTHNAFLHKLKHRMPHGAYVYQLVVDGAQVSGKLIL